MEFFSPSDALLEIYALDLLDDGPPRPLSQIPFEGLRPRIVSRQLSSRPEQKITRPAPVILRSHHTLRQLMGEYNRRPLTRSIIKADRRAP